MKPVYRLNKDIPDLSGTNPTIPAGTLVTIESDEGDYLIVERTDGSKSFPVDAEDLVAIVSTPTVPVHNLATGETVQYVGPSPRECVIAAYAQERRDWNTWDYARRYSHLVEEGPSTFLCGDWVARKPL